MEPDPTAITAKDLNGALRKAKGNSKELIEAEVDYGRDQKSGLTLPRLKRVGFFTQ